ncbi:MAG: hypothetical protein KAI77_00435 [Gammaproteobacteria bacterium]|nr:hypothetical protein [Gammaproteobacteria bacterium]
MGGSTYLVSGVLCEGNKVSKNTLSPGAELATQRKKEITRYPVCHTEFEGIKKAVY